LLPSRTNATVSEKGAQKISPAAAQRRNVKTERENSLGLDGLHGKYVEEEDFSRKGAKRCRVSTGFLCAFARETSMLIDK